MEPSNNPVSLEEVLQQVKFLNLEEQRSKFMETDVYLAFNEYEKAINILALYDEKSEQKIFVNLLENIKKALQSGSPQTEALQNELFSITKIRTSCCGECRVSGHNGCYRWNIFGQKYCEPC